MTTYPLNDWLPESDPHSGFALWNDFQTVPYNEHNQRETTAQPIVVPWNQFEPRVTQKKAIRDSLRNQGFCFWPWVISKHFQIDWQDFSQGNRGSCAGCATNHAVNAMLLTHMADGYRHRGIGKQMLESLKNAGKEQGASRFCFLAVAREPNDPRRHAGPIDTDIVFRKFGFEKTALFVTFEWATIQMDGSVQTSPNRLDLWVNQKCVNGSRKL